MAFVSAGTSEPLKILDELLETNKSLPPKDSSTEPSPSGQSPLPVDSESPKEGETRDDGDDSDDEEGEDDDELIGPEELEEELEEAIQRKQVVVEEKATFFFDVKGDPSKAKPSKEPVKIPDRPSSRSSSSSEEVILFKGRDSQRRVQPTTEITMTQMRTEIQVVEEQILAGPSTLLTQTRKKKTKSKRLRKARTQGNDDDDADIDDYIANMLANGDADDILGNAVGNHRDLGGTDYFIPDDLSSDCNPDELGGVDDNDNDDDAAVSTSEIDDETLAKLIAGQELGTNEDAGLDNALSDSSSSSEENKAKREPNTTDDFDVMDWERPSLRRKKKGKGAQAQMSFNMSDSELEQALQAAWKSDRMKKSERKREREQLRALGMLGKKANPDDLRVKYPDGMSMEQVADEFRTFLLGTDETVIFPPMDNHARKMVHELANKFKIKSKSTGSAEQRRPTLIRTLRTQQFVESTFDQAVGRVGRRYFPRLDLRGKRSQRAPPVRTNNSAATYQDGEIIGAAAPELGTENRGRTMLEKMGWSSGTALGADNNKGILQPVTQTMKRSKAGLG